MKQALFGILSLIFLVSMVSAQVVTDINLHGVEATALPFHIIGGSGGGSSAALNKLQVDLSLLSSQISAGLPFDYQVVITNTSDTEILVPQATSWSDVLDKDASKQSFTEGFLSFTVQTENGARGHLDGEISLYGSPSSPGTTVRLAPGDSVRLSGTAKASPVWDAGSAAKIEGIAVDATLQADFSINSVRLHPAAAKAGHGAYRQDSLSLYWAQSKPATPIQFIPAD